MGDVVDMLQRLAAVHQASQGLPGKGDPSDALNPMPNTSGMGAPDIQGLIGAMRSAQGFPQSSPRKMVANDNSQTSKGDVVSEILSALNNIQSPQFAPQPPVSPPMFNTSSPANNNFTFRPQGQ